VWRADRPARGRFREFYQCDVDAIGSRSLVVEAELCAAVSDVLVTLGFREYSLRLNHRGLLQGILEHAQVPASLHDQALIALDKLDKIGRAGVMTEMQARGISAETGDRLLQAFATGGLGPEHGVDRLNEARLGHVARHIGDNPAGAAALEDLRTIVRLCAATTARPYVIVDPWLARGLSYYTGAIMEIAVADLAGSLGGGGRYDGLIGMFLGDDIPACGFSLGLERILVVMAERNMFPPGVQTAAVDALVTLFEGEPPEEALRLAADLRAAGVRVDVYPDPDKLSKQFKYAAGRGVRFVLVQGADERARHQVTVKNMETGEQASVPRDRAASDIAARLQPAPAPEAR
jgi:histidyl-tRNA synthetase